MCFGEETKRSKSSRRRIQRMDQLGYQVGHPVAGVHPIDGSRQWFYPVRDQYQSSIALLAASSHDGLLIVPQINTERDMRPDRPLASDILLSFWKYKAQIPIRSLRGVFFETVENRSTQDIRAEVYRNLNRELSERVLLDRDTNEDDTEREFRRTRDRSKLGRCARTLATEYIETKEYRFDVGSVEFVPKGRHGEGFHLVVAMRQQQSKKKGKKK